MPSLVLAGLEVSAKVTAEPTASPPVSQTGAAVALKHSENATLPVASSGEPAPVTVTVAVSVTGVPGETVPFWLAPAASLTWVVTAGVQVPSWPRMKSFRTAVVEVDERVSDRTLEKHCPPRLRADRLMPAS